MTVIEESSVAHSAPGAIIPPPPPTPPMPATPATATPATATPAAATRRPAMAPTPLPPPPPPSLAAAATLAAMSPLAPPSVDIDVDLSPRALVDEGYIEKREGLSRLPKVPFELFAAVVVGAILLGAAAVSNLNGQSEAEAEQRLAEALLVSAEVDGTNMAETNASLAVANTDLEAVIGNLETDLAASEAATAQAVADLAAVPEFDTTPLDDEIADLRSDNSDLRVRAETAETNLTDIAASEASPGFDQYVGERLAQQSLSATDAQCFGSAVIADVGLEVFGAGINSDRTTAANDVLIDAMARSAASCGISSTTVFGG